MEQYVIRLSTSFLAILCRIMWFDKRLVSIVQIHYPGWVGKIAVEKFRGVTRAYTSTNCDIYKPFKMSNKVASDET